MGCPFRTPAGALEAVRACVMAILNPEPPDPLPEGYVPPVVPTVVVGPQGVGGLYGCCDNGLLRIEWLTAIPTAPANSFSVSGVTCHDDLAATIRITLSRCVNVFDSGNTGRAIDPTVRNAAAQVIMAEAFDVLQGLLCCIREEAWEDCGVRFISQNMHSPYGQCWPWSIDLRANLMACCS